MFAFCVNRLGSRDEAEDAVQSTFLNAHRALQRGVTPEVEIAWLFKIAHNVCLTRRRSSHRRGRIESASDLQSMQDVIPAPQRESSDELMGLTDALAGMPESQRRAILLREWQGLSYHEIADELQLSQSAVETLIFRARRSLAANLEVEPERRGLVARAKAAVDVGTLLAALRTLFEGGAAVKAAAAAVAVSSATVIATGSAPSPEEARVRVPSAPSVASAPANVVPMVVEERAPVVERAPRVGSPAADAKTPMAEAPSVAKPAAAAAAAPETSATPAVVPMQPAAPEPAPAAAAKQKADPPTRTAAVHRAKPEKKEKAPKPVTPPAAIVAPPASAAAASPAEPGPPEHAAKPEEKKDKEHGPGNGNGNG